MSLAKVVPCGSETFDVQIGDTFCSDCGPEKEEAEEFASHVNAAHDEAVRDEVFKCVKIALEKDRREQEEITQKAVQEAVNSEREKQKQSQVLDTMELARLIEQQKNESVEQAEKPIREVLCTHGFCGDGNLRNMVDRALQESCSRYATEAFNVIQEIGDMCGDIEGTLVERVKKLLEKSVQDAARPLVKALENIIAHQKLAGGTFGDRSSIVLIAKKALEEFRGRI